MQIFDNDATVFVDVDDTLVLWSPELKQKRISINDPYVEGMVNRVVPHQKHIDLVKRWKGRGYTVIVWSAGGYKWAEAVVKALSLDEYVDVVMSKPTKYLDDLDSSEWMGTRLYLEPNKNVK